MGLDKPHTLYRLGGDLSVTNLGDVQGFPEGYVNAAGITNTGDMYYRHGPSSDFYQLDLPTLTASLVCNFSDIGGQQDNIGDIAYNPIDGYFYGTRDNSNILVKLDLENCTETQISLSRHIQDANGAFYIAADGTAYGYENESGKFTQINLSTGLVEDLGSSAPTSVSYTHLTLPTICSV